MKRALTIVLALVFAISFTACEKAPFVTMNGPRSYTFTREGGSQRFTFSCNRDWSVSSSESWIKVSPSSGTKSDEAVTVTITCSPNTEYDPRNATITVRVEELMETISVIQDENIGLSAPSTKIEVSYKEQTTSVKMLSNVQYTVEIDTDAKSWISLVSTKGLSESTINLSISKNDGFERTGKVSIQYENLKEDITIKQDCGVIEFDDAAFKAYCITRCDNDLDGEVSYSEALNVTYLAVPLDVSSVKGVEFFQNITSFNSSPNNLTSLDLSKNTKLEIVGCFEGQITYLDVSGCVALQQLECYSNKLSELNLSHNPVLVSLNCAWNQLSELDLSNCPLLKNINCGSNQLSSLDVQCCTSLSVLGCDNNQISNLDISSLNMLTGLSCSSNKLTSLDLGNNTSLGYLSCIDNRITELSVSNCPKLFYLSCSNTDIQRLDVSNNLDLITLYCWGNPNLKEIWLRSGQTIGEFLYDKNIATVKYRD